MPTVANSASGKVRTVISLERSVRRLTTPNALTVGLSDSDRFAVIAVSPTATVQRVNVEKDGHLGYIEVR